jgi:hypothetical protein
MFDAGPWERPARYVRRLTRHGVGAVFVQTSNYRHPHDVHRPEALGRMLGSAHRHGMQVVAWYLPGFDDPRRDWRRIAAAVGYQAASGDRFDGFALDIEATAVRDITVRNRRMLRLSNRVRRFAGEPYPLGAIIPDPVSQRCWPRFPYRAVAARYDAILPARPRWRCRRSCGSRRRGRSCGCGSTAASGTYARVRGSLPRRLRSSTTPADVRGFVRATVACRAAGASLYDAPITSAEQWRQLRLLGRP